MHDSGIDYVDCSLSHEDAQQLHGCMRLKQSSCFQLRLLGRPPVPASRRGRSAMKMLTHGPTCKYATSDRVSKALWSC